MSLLDIILNRRGKAMAITARELADRLGQRDDRAIRLGIRLLIAEGHPIASTTQPPYGYYIPETPEEADHYLRSLRSRLIEDALRRRDFKKAYQSMNHPVRQLSLL